MLAAQGKAESNFNPRAGSHAGAQGIAQFLPGTWKEWSQGGDIWNPADAIPAQGRFMCALSKDRHVLAAFHARGGQGNRASLPFVLSSYNGGVGAVRKFNGVPPYAETQGYIGKILDWSGQYEGMDAELIKRVQSVLNASNHNLWLRYGHRSIEEQQRLWDEKVAQLDGDTVEAAKWVANPAEKRSAHLDGLAADINGDLGLLARLAPQHGLKIPMSWEPWHVEKR